MREDNHTAQTVYEEEMRSLNDRYGLPFTISSRFTHEYELQRDGRICLRQCIVTLRRDSHHSQVALSLDGSFDSIIKAIHDAACELYPYLINIEVSFLTSNMGDLKLEGMANISLRFEEQGRKPWSSHRQDRDVIQALIEAYWLGIFWRIHQERKT